MKTFFKIISLFIIIIFLFILYLSIFGIETKRFNNQISNRLKNINENIEIDLKKIKITLNILKLKLDAKTFDSQFVINNKKIEIGNIKTQISIVSFICFAVTLEIIFISGFLNSVLFISSLIFSDALFINSQ